MISSIVQSERKKPTLLLDAFRYIQENFFFHKSERTITRFREFL
jgi:hypothetical protein